MQIVTAINLKEALNKMGIQLIGQKVYLTTKYYQGVWGVIKYYDGEHYHVAVWGDPTHTIMLYENQFIINEQKEVGKGMCNYPLADKKSL